MSLGRSQLREYIHTFSFIHLPIHSIVTEHSAAMALFLMSQSMHIAMFYIYIQCFTNIHSLLQ